MYKVLRRLIPISIVFLVYTNVGAATLVDSIKIENEKLKQEILRLELKKQIMDSITINGTPILNEKIVCIEKKSEHMQSVLFAISGMYLVLIGIIGAATWYRSDVISRNTARDEFNKNFKDNQDEIIKLVAEAREMHKEISFFNSTIAQQSSSEGVNIEEIKRRNRDGKTD